MSKNLLIGCLSVSDKICIGTVSKGLWQKDRVDVTNLALSCVAEHLYKVNEMFVIERDGKKLALSLREITDDEIKELEIEAM